MNSLTDMFVSVCKTVLEKSDLPPHRLAIAIDSESAVLEFPAVDNTGFDVNVGVNATEIIIGGGVLWHRHLDFISNPRELVEKAFGQTRTLLCPDSRLIEKYSDGKLYSAAMEEHDGNNWIRGKAVTLIFWNYFGSREKLILINEHLPAIMQN